MIPSPNTYTSDWVSGSSMFWDFGDRYRIYRALWACFSFHQILLKSAPHWFPHKTAGWEEIANGVPANDLKCKTFKGKKKLINEKFSIFICCRWQRQEIGQIRFFLCPLLLSLSIDYRLWYVSKQVFLTLSSSLGFSIIRHCFPPMCENKENLGRVPINSESKQFT